MPWMPQEQQWKRELCQGVEQLCWGVSLFLTISKQKIMTRQLVRMMAIFINFMYIECSVLTFWCKTLLCAMPENTGKHASLFCAVRGVSDQFKSFAFSIPFRHSTEILFSWHSSPLFCPWAFQSLLEFSNFYLLIACRRNFEDLFIVLNVQTIWYISH